MSGMRHRESGRDCPCCSQWAPTRAGEKRAWRRWRHEYDETPDERLTDWCPHDLRPCPNDTRDCCTGGQSEHICSTLTAVREYYASLGFQDVDTPDRRTLSNPRSPDGRHGDESRTATPLPRR